ncbi:MAG TPA: alpha/beta fold hydrolase [Micromonosporaceae bacterium]|nr:alpha/beta fold hydrolase [Micromonosporaceae bacterium]
MTATHPGVVRSESTGWLRRPRPRPHARVRLVCLPHAGGSASFYRALAAALPDHIETVAVQYPGREDRFTEPCVPDLRRLAGLVTEALLPLLDRPVALFGHSLGACVGHEVALRLQQRARPPAHLFVSAQPAPRHLRPGTIHLAGDDALLAELRRVGGLASGVLDDPELRAIVLPAVRADYRAIETYRPVPVPPLDCPVTALVGTEDPDATIDQARDWAAYTAARFELRVLPGGHFYLGEHLSRVSADIAARLGGGAWPDLP